MTTMSKYEQQQYVAVFPNFRDLKLPYSCKSGDQWHQTTHFYMLLLLPDNDHSLGDVYDKVVSTSGFIRKHTPVGKVPVGQLMVPKFKFTFEFEASEEMQRLGVSIAFEGGDFSNMFASGGVGLPSWECTIRPPLRWTRRAPWPPRPRPWPSA